MVFPALAGEPKNKMLKPVKAVLFEDLKNDHVKKLLLLDKKRLNSIRLYTNDFLAVINLVFDLLAEAHTEPTKDLNSILLI